MEKIIRIEETYDKVGTYNSSAEGYAIITDKQTIKLLIDSEQSCCENFGYFMSEDNFTDFIGSEIIDVTLTDTELKTIDMKERGVDINSSWFEGGVMFVNINTTKGLLQFVAYNEHNGYYGHTAYVISGQLNHSEGL